MIEGKIGVGVLTCGRYDYVVQCLESIFDSGSLDGLDIELILLQDGNDYTEEQNKVLQALVGESNYYMHENSGCSVSKNFLVKELRKRGVEHYFLVEDDMLLLKGSVFSDYIAHAKDIGVSHLNFALHGPANKEADGTPKGTVWGGKAVYYPHCVGSFSYYHYRVWHMVGFFDENFLNAWEHVEHTYRIALARLTSPFWYFLDHPNSNELIKEIEGSIDYSSIRPRSDWQDNIKNGREYWISKWNGEFLPPKPNGWKGYR